MDFWEANTFVASLKKAYLQHCEQKVTMKPFSLIWMLQTLQWSRKKLSFIYYKNDENTKLVPKRKGRYEVTPLYVLYKDESYYLIAFDDVSQRIKNYRLDRMKKTQVSSKEATETEDTKSFDIEKYQRGTFLMYPGSSVKVTLKVQENAMNAVADAFDKNNVIIIDISEGAATIFTEVKESPTFYSWSSQFNGDITLEGPEDTQQRYVKYLEGLLTGMQFNPWQPCLHAFSLMAAILTGNSH